MDTTQHNNGDFQTAAKGEAAEMAITIVRRMMGEMHLRGREAHLHMVAYHEDELIKMGLLDRRTKPPNRTRDK